MYINIKLKYIFLIISIDDAAKDRWNFANIIVLSKEVGKVY